MAPTSLVRRMTFVVGVASICAPSVVHGQVITLTEAVRTAESHDRSIHIAKLDRDKALREIDVARTRRYPIFSVTALGSQPLTQLGITLERGSLGVYPFDGPIPGQTTTLESPLRFGFIGYASVQQPLTQHTRSAWGSSSPRSASTQQPNRFAPSAKASSTKCDVSTTASRRPRAAGQRFGQRSISSASSIARRASRSFSAWRYRLTR